jgi:hypothetical protein
MDNIDEQLLGGQNRGNEAAGKNAAARAGALNQAKHKNKKGKGKKEQGNNQTDNQSDDEDNDVKTLREATQADRRGQSLTEKLKNKARDAAAKTVSKGTSKLLQASWENLIDSFGLTLIWINIHVWLGTVFGNDFFCKLGAEWVDENIKTAQADYAKSQGKLIGTIEPMGLACCDLGCLFIIIAIASLVAMIASVLSLDFEAVKAVLGSFWDTIKKIF